GVSVVDDRGPPSLKSDRLHTSRHRFQGGYQIGERSAVNAGDKPHGTGSRDVHHVERADQSAPEVVTPPTKAVAVAYDPRGALGREVCVVDAEIGILAVSVPYDTGISVAYHCWSL